MRVRSRLPLRIAARSGMLNKCHCLTECALVLNRKHSNAAAAVVRHKEPFPGPIELDVAWTVTLRRHGIQELQSAAVPIDGKCADRAGRIFSNRIKKMLIGMHR